ncbi:hypothetical protein ES703_04301 [subsurface metagenome]
MKEYSKYLKKAEDLGAKEAKIIPAKSIVTAEWVKLKCQFGCNRYGRNERGVVLFCHGNAGNISHRLESIQIFYDPGLSTFIFDYRGYGLSEGKTTEQGTYLDAKAVWRYLVQERKIEPASIIIFGRSLGGSIAAWLARESRPKALILESSFTSIRNAAADMYPRIPSPFREPAQVPVL